MRVRDILSNSEQHYLSIENVAEYLHMSDRTLKRQLAAEGTSFSTLYTTSENDKCFKI